MNTLITIGAIAIVVTLAYCSTKDEVEKYYPSFCNYDSDRKELVDLINRHRADLGLCRVTPELQLTQMAEVYCQYVIDSSKVSHDNFEKRKTQAFQSGFTYYGEIFSAGYNTNEKILEAYLNSPKHKEIIESYAPNYIGISKMKNKNGTNFNAIIFCFY